MEVQDAELVKNGERVNGAAEVEGREGECGHTAISAFDSDPRGSTGGGSGAVGEGPVGVESAMQVCLGTEESEGGRVIGGDGDGRDRKAAEEKKKQESRKIHRLMIRAYGGKS